MSNHFSETIKSSKSTLLELQAAADLKKIKNI
jgi:hypothetical protein